MIRSSLRPLFLFLAAVVFGQFTTSCLPLVAGAAVGYLAAEEGYRVQSPIKKEENP